MKRKFSPVQRVALIAALLVLAGLLSPGPAAADQPLSKDDVTLLLLASSPSAKIIQIVEARGVDFQMTSDLAKTFHDQGAGDAVIDALRKAGSKPAAAKASAPAAEAPPPATANPNPAPAPEASPEGKPNAPDAPEPRAAEPPAATPAKPESSPANEPVLHTRNSTAAEPAPAASAPSLSAGSRDTRTASQPIAHESSTKEAETVAPPVVSAPNLKDPDAQGIQHIIQEFAAKEKVFREARNNYTYHQINKVQELGAENEIVGVYEQEWDILYDDAGKRIEKVTYAPLNSLKNLIITKEDIEGFRNIQPFVLTTDELPDYEIKYLGHVKVDQITAYVFSIRPKAIEKNRQYFQGVVWVDDRDLQIVKSEGKQVPQAKVSHGQENLFPRFTTWREQVDGKFWFPTYTMADDTLYFSQGAPIHMKEVVRYTDYKQFKSGARILSVESIDKQKDQSNPPADSKKK